MVQVVNAQHHLPQVCTLSPVTHTPLVCEVKIKCGSLTTHPEALPLEAVCDCQSPLPGDEDAAADVSALTALQRALPGPRPPPGHPATQNPLLPVRVKAHRLA